MTNNIPKDREVILRADFRRYLELGLEPLWRKLNFSDKETTERLYNAIVEANMMSVEADRQALLSRIEAAIPPVIDTTNREGVYEREPSQRDFDYGQNITGDIVRAAIQKEREML